MARRVKIPNELLLRIREDECVIFLGDIIYDGTDIPTRLVIAQILARTFDCPEEPHSLPRVAQHYSNLYGRQKLIGTLREIVANHHHSPLPIHTALAELPVSVIATTNYDDLLERAHKKATYDVITIDADASYVSKKRKTILRLSGRLDIEATLIVTEDDYFDVKKESRLSDIVRSQIATRTPIFLGCNLEDPVLKEFYMTVSRGLGKHARRAYAIHENVPDYVSRLWSERNVTYVDIAGDDFLSAVKRKIRKPPSRDRQRLFDFRARLQKEPFKFLAYFDEGDADIFYGRNDDITRVLNKIAYCPLVVLHSQSGVGKTSLIRAGLIPLLKTQGADSIYLTSWRPIIGELLSALRANNKFGQRLTAPQSDVELATTLLTELSRGGKNLIVFLDQFEEFFLSTEMSERDRYEFIDLLAYCTSGNTANLHFVLSLREDFLAELYEIQQKLRTNYANYYRLRPLSKEQATDAIREPLNQLGIRISDDLINHLLSELSDANSEIYPPQLQIVCSKLTRIADPGQAFIGLEDLKRLGSVKSILANYVNEVLLLFSEKRQASAKLILKALVTSHKTKMRLDRNALSKRSGELGQDFDVILKTLDEHRLIRREEKEGHFYYELTHEYIIERINDWITTEEFAARRAQEYVDQEFYNWSTDAEYEMAKDRFAAINNESDKLDLSIDTTEFLLLTAIQHGYGVEYWAKRLPSPSEGLLTRVTNVLRQGSARARRTAAVVLAFWNLNESLLDQALKTLSEIGNSHVWTQLKSLFVPEGFLLKARHVISERFVRKMVKVEGGLFTMGSTRDELTWVLAHFEIPKGWIEKETPQHRLLLGDFYIDQFLITNEEFQEFDPNYQFPVGEEKHPAVNIDWSTARRYSDWVGKSLPSEAEWEKAARGEDGRRFPWGDEFCLGKANSEETGIGGTTPVGSFPEGISPYGCYDMAGNVFEWTSSLNFPYPYQESDGREDCEVNGKRILRGGAFSYNSSLLRCALRYDYYNATRKANSVGFRCAFRGHIADHAAFLR